MEAYRKLVDCEHFEAGYCTEACVRDTFFLKQKCIMSHPPKDPRFRFCALMKGCMGAEPKTIPSTPNLVESEELTPEQPDEIEATPCRSIKYHSSTKILVMSDGAQPAPRARKILKEALGSPDYGNRYEHFICYQGSRKFLAIYAAVKMQEFEDWITALTLVSYVDISAQRVVPALRATDLEDVTGSICGHVVYLEDDAGVITHVASYVNSGGRGERIGKDFSIIDNSLLGTMPETITYTHTEDGRYGSWSTSPHSKDPEALHATLRRSDAGSECLTFPLYDLELGHVAPLYRRVGSPTDDIRIWKLSGALRIIGGYPAISAIKAVRNERYSKDLSLLVIKGHGADAVKYLLVYKGPLIEVYRLKD